MQEFLHDVPTGLDYAMLSVLITNSARALLATTAAFARTRRRREAALRALRTLSRRRDNDRRI